MAAEDAKFTMGEAVVDGVGKEEAVEVPFHDESPPGHFPGGPPGHPGPFPGPHGGPPGHPPGGPPGGPPGDFDGPPPAHPPPPSPYNDEVSEMTYGRRLARYLSDKYDWYNPSKNVRGPHPAHLDVAWEYFEHSKLPRHFLPGTSVERDPTAQNKSFHRRRNKRDVLQRAEYGEEEEKTVLYSVLKTPEAELGDFGLGVGIYFWTLRVLCIITLIAGLINIPNMIHFASDDYGEGGQSGEVSFGVLGSVACVDNKWVACPTCTKDDWDRFPRDYSRFATDSDGNSFIFKNNCSVGFDEAIVSWAAFLFVMVSIFVMNIISKYREQYIDSLSQTSSDYSIAVENPPEDATDPEEWKDFFYSIANSEEPIHVTLVTVTVDNKELVDILVKRRKYVQNMIYMLKPRVRVDRDNLEEMAQNTEELKWYQKKLLFQQTGPELLESIKKLDAKAKEVSKKSFGASNVFVTFETEAQQKAMLNKLVVPRRKIWSGGASVPDELKFRGTHLLAVKEPAEPSSIRWEDLDTSLRDQLIQRVISTVLVVAAIAAGAALVQVVKNRTDSATYAALTVAAINQITPYICKFCNKFESHANDGSRQTSLYTKTTLFKWTNTAIVTAIITPFTDTGRYGSGHLVNSIYAIFFAELLTNPAIKLSDFWGHIQRHYLGPRAKDQRRMNLKFGGGTFVLSDRYTEVTKILFLTFFYSALYPAGFFFCAASLFINYWVDKFSLLRVWGPSPQVGAGIASFSRSYFFTSALLVYAIMLSYNYSGFPFDDVCDTGTNVTSDYVGTFSAETAEDDPETVEITIESDESTYVFCLQDFLRYSRNGLGTAFPAIPSFQQDGLEWMTDGQETGSSLLGWTSVAVLVIVVMIIINRSVVAIVRNFLIKPDVGTGGELSEQRFSESKETIAYVPQIKSSTSDMPYLLCDISGLNEDLVDFDDPHMEFPFDQTNLIYELPELSESDNDLFSVIKFWPPRMAIHH